MDKGKGVAELDTDSSGTDRHGRLGAAAVVGKAPQEAVCVRRTQVETLGRAVLPQGHGAPAGPQAARCAAEEPGKERRDAVVAGRERARGGGGVLVEAG